MAGKRGPAGAVLQNIEQVSLAYAGMDLGFEDHKTLRPAGSLLLLQVWHAAGINAQFHIFRKASIHSGGGGHQLFFHPCGKCLARMRQSKIGAIISQTCFTVRPGQELTAVIIKGLRADDKDIASLQRIG
ncbi:hypothetical protein J4T87_0021205 (plasmid) [Rhizobium sp. T1473]|uniref:hypothetical protein n=1 Tax=Rhizobium sp. T1473 TaxID=555321 RepID=UPI001CD5C474|nr:hypothetical protein [Rhizobium sp. T1473]MCA0806145.1 hypothetical protein [Rhizobium sp. T1473]